MRRLTIFLVGVFAVALMIASWRWSIVHLSQLTGTSNSSSRAYDFWSGFGSDLGEATLIVGVLAAYRHHNCHVKGCPRLGRVVDGTPYIACPRHHPDHDGEKRGISHEELLRAHRGGDEPSSEQWSYTGPTTANPHNVHVTDFTLTPKEHPMSLLSDIEKRFEGASERVIADAERVARSQIGQTLLEAGKTILPLLPEGPEATLVLRKLQEVEDWAQRALAAIESGVQPPAQTAPPAAPTGFFTTTLVPGTFDAASWPAAAYKTQTGLQLYTWAGQGPAPADAAWAPYEGPIVAV